MQTYKNIPRLIAGLTLLCISSFATSFELTPFSLNLEAKRFGTVDLKLTGIQTLSKLQNNQWQYQLQTNSSFVKIIETSKFEWENNQVTPISYHNYNRIAFVKNIENATFDSNFKEIIVKQKKDKKTYPFIAGIMDKNSFQVKLMEELSLGKTEFSFLIQEIRKQTKYDFRVIKQERLKTPMGEMESIKIEQIWKTPNNKEKFIWVSKNYGYIPLLIENYSSEKLTSRIRVTGGTYNGNIIKASTN